MRFRMWRCCFTLDTAEGTGQICTMPQQRHIACSWQNQPPCQGSCAGLACPDDVTFAGTSAAECIEASPNSEESVWSVRAYRQLAASLDH